MKTKPKRRFALRKLIDNSEDLDSIRHWLLEIIIADKSDLITLLSELPPGKKRDELVTFSVKLFEWTPEQDAILTEFLHLCIKLGPKAMGVICTRYLKRRKTK